MTTIVARSSNAAAEAAAQDAAREEVAERSAKKGSSKSPKVGKDGWHRFTVDVWITNFNSIEFGIYKRSRNRAKSRQFTADMDIFAEIIENGERTGLIGYREDLWKQKSGMDKRLVFKLFNETVNWRATMDLMVGRSLQMTIGSRGLPVIYLERSANKWPLLPENFSFFLMNDNQPEFYRLKRDLIDLGGDYTLYDQQGNVVGALDGKVFSLGGKWYGKVKEGHADRRLMTVMKLFAGMLIFNADSRRHMKALYRDVRRGKIKPRIEAQEADLYRNPRRTR
jgi:hypothetical protein